jgi:hypothetical protein
VRPSDADIASPHFGVQLEQRREIAVLHVRQQ